MSDNICSKSSKPSTEVQKPKKTKSRNGCVTCKKRRLKCDEAKPLCQNCIKRGIVCGGYAINFKWRDFSEQTNAHKPNTRQPSNNSQNSNSSKNPALKQNGNVVVKLEDHQSLIGSNPAPKVAGGPKKTTNNHSSMTEPLSRAQPHSVNSHSNITLQPSKEPSRENGLQKALEDATFSVTGKSTQEIAIANVLIANGKNPEVAAAIASTLTSLSESDNVNEIISQLKSKGTRDSQLEMNYNKNLSHADTAESQTLKNDSVANLHLNDNDNENEMIDENKNINNIGTLDNIEDVDEIAEDNAIGNVNVNSADNEDEIDHSILDGNIQPKKLLDNFSNKSNNLLHSLADIAAKIPPSPIAPLSPFNESFASDAFIQKIKQMKNENELQLKSNYPKININLPPINPDLLNKNTKESPLNLFKDSPKLTSDYSPQLFPKSPNISGFLSNFQQENQQDTQIMQLSGLNSGQPTPKFIEEIDAGFQPYVKFSPFNPDTFSNNSNHISIGNFVTSPKAFASNSPQIYNMVSLLNNKDSTPNKLVPSKNNSYGDSSIYSAETSKMFNQSNPASPYSTLLNYANATQLIERDENKYLAKKSLEDNHMSDDNDNTKVSRISSSIMQQRHRGGSLSSINSESEPNSPKSVTSDISTVLDIVENAHRPQLLLPQTPVNLYSLHMPDEHLTTLLAFDQYTCGIMSIKNGPTENPWRTFLLPMSVDHQVVRSALLAMTCFHVARGDSVLRARGVKFMKDAIVSLVHGLSTDSNSSSRVGNISTNEIVKRTPPDVALATCIALAMSEAWDRHISTGIAHLKGAKSMIIKVLKKLENKKRSKRKRSKSMGSSQDAGSNISELSSVSLGAADSLQSTTSEVFGDNYKQNNMDNSDELNKLKLPKELQFLVNAWMYFDVLARMTSNCESSEEEGDDEEGLNRNDFGPVETDPFPSAFKSSDSENNSVEDEISSTSLKRGSSQNFGSISSSSTKRSKQNSKKSKKKKEADSASIIKKFRSFNLDDGDTIDPLLGVAQTLFPIMGEVATLISCVRMHKLKCKSSNGAFVPDSLNGSSVKTPLRLISRTVELKSAIEHWKIPSLPKFSHDLKAEDPTFDLNAAVATAEAYRYATLLYLHQTVPEVPSATSHSLAENVMMLLASVPASSRTLVTHMFPLFVSSCEARPGDEREWAKDRWTELIDKMWIGTIERAWEVVKEVWARKDAMSGKRRKKIYIEKPAFTADSAGRMDVQEENPEVEYNKVKRRISMVIHGNDDDLIDDDDNNVGSWSHWTTVMKEWGWEVLLA